MKAVVMNRVHRVSKGLGALALVGVVGAAIVACGDRDGAAPPDTVLRNGYIYTQDANNSVQQAVAIKDGVIVYVGSNAGAAKLVGSNTKVVDLGGRMLMPGFVDGHLHPIAGGRALLLCDLKYQSLTRTQMASAIQACLDNSSGKEPDTWLEVVNWSRQGTQAVDADPDKSILDALNTKRPILVRSSDFHSVLTNSRGLALAGVTNSTPNPAGGTFAHDAQGNLTGICEDAASFVIAAQVPADSDADLLQQGRAALAAMRAQGVTSFMDAAAGATQGKVFTSLQKSGELTARAHLTVNLAAEDAKADPVKAVADAKALAATYDQGAILAQPSVSYKHIKIFADGVVNAPADTGALLTPYFTNVGTDAAPNWQAGSNLGNLYFPAEVLNPLMVEIAKSGLDPHIHATGERAVRVALDAYEHARKQVPTTDFRPAIAHAETVATADYARFKALDVTATFSFQWAQQAPYSVGETANHLGAERFARMEPSGSLSLAGARIAYGSDWPIDPFDEMLALKVGVTRSGDPQSPNSFGPDMAGKINAEPGLSRAQVLRAITLNAAYQLRLEKKVGSVEVGKLADLIVLDKNFMQVPEEELARNTVLLTLVGGKAVYALDPFSSVLPTSATASAKRLGILNLSAAANRAPDPMRAGVHGGDGHNH
jgi:predicted amidohydrolase YtcJ